MWEFSEAITGEQLEDSESEQKSSEIEKTHRGLFQKLWDELRSGPEEKPKSKTSNNEDSAKDANPEKSKVKPAAEASKTETTNKRFIFSITPKQHSPRSGVRVADDRTADQNTESTTSNSGSALNTSSVDLNGSPEPRYRTRSARSPDT
jgi:hypothetical protein